MLFVSCFFLFSSCFLFSSLLFISGAERSLRISRKVLCPKCKGSGAKGGETKKCKVCNGQGVQLKLQQLFVFFSTLVFRLFCFVFQVCFVVCVRSAPGFNVQMQQPCEACGGTGKVAKATCPHCSGQKTVMEEKSLEVIIEKGMKDGEEIVFERASEQSPDIM
jgi:DnaJ-class molecular chaperone